MSGDNEESTRSELENQSVYPDTEPERQDEGELDAPYENFFLGAYEGSNEIGQSGNSSPKDIYPQDLPP